MTIKAVIITTQPPRGDNPGACEIGHYKVENGFVIMCNEDGRPTGKKCRLKASNCVTHYVIERVRRFLARRHKVQGAAIADSHSMLGTFGADRSLDPQGIVF